MMGHIKHFVKLDLIIIDDPQLMAKLPDPPSGKEFAGFCKAVEKKLMAALHVPFWHHEPGFNNATTAGYSNHYVEAAAYSELTGEQILANCRKVELELEGLRLSERLPAWISHGRHGLGRALALADRAFTRSIHALATYHRLAR